MTKTSKKSGPRVLTSIENVKRIMEKEQRKKEAEEIKKRKKEERLKKAEERQRLKLHKKVKKYNQYFSHIIIIIINFLDYQKKATKCYSNVNASKDDDRGTFDYDDDEYSYQSTNSCNVEGIIGDVPEYV